MHDIQSKGLNLLLLDNNRDEGDNLLGVREGEEREKLTFAL
jgi:hypothetical protein